MPILRGNRAGSARDKVMRLDDFAIPDDAKQWLVKELGGDTFSSEKLDVLEAKAGLTRAQRDLLAGMQLSRQGTLRTADGTVMGSDGVQRGSELNAPLRAAASMLHGLAELESRVRAQMPPALVGQHHTQAAFEKMAAAHESVVRRPAPLMTLVGPPGHGKDEAISGYAKALFGDAAEPIAVEVSSFDKADELQKAIDEAVAALPDGGVVRFTGVEDLATTKPKHANAMLAHLSKHRQDASEPRISYFLDFDRTEGSPREATTGALSAMGNRLLSAEAGFCMLDAEAMRIYAKRLLPELMAVDSMKDIRLDWTPEALELLGDFLATPHSPLIDLEQRLTESVLIAVSVRKSVDALDVVRIDVARPVAKDEALRATLLEALHEEAPDYFKAEDLFTSLVVANQGIDLDREAVIADGHKNLASLLEQATEAVFHNAGRSAAKKQLVEMVGAVFQDAATHANGISDAAAHCIDENRQVVVPPALRSKLTERVKALMGADLGHLAKDPLVRAALTTAAVGFGLEIPADLAITAEELDKSPTLKLAAGTSALVMCELAAATSLSASGATVSEDAVDANPWNKAYLPADPALRLVRLEAKDDVTTTLSVAAGKPKAPKVPKEPKEPALDPKALDLKDLQNLKPEDLKNLKPEDLGGALGDVLKGLLGGLGGKPVDKPVDKPVEEPAQDPRIALAQNGEVDVSGARRLITIDVPVGADGWARLRANAKKHDVIRVGNDSDGTLFTREREQPTEAQHKASVEAGAKTRFGSEHGGELNIGVHAPGKKTVTVSLEKVGEWLAWQDLGDARNQEFACAKDDRVRVAMNRNNGVTVEAFARGDDGKVTPLVLDNGIATMPFAGELLLKFSRAGSCRLFVEKLLPDV